MSKVGSKGKQYDISVRALVLEIIVVCVRSGDTENAKNFGAFSSTLKDRIQNYGYKTEDEEYAASVRLDREWNTFCETHKPLPEKIR